MPFYPDHVNQNKAKAELLSIFFLALIDKRWKVDNKALKNEFYGARIF